MTNKRIHIMFIRRMEVIATRRNNDMAMDNSDPTLNARFVDLESRIEHVASATFTNLRWIIAIYKSLYCTLTYLWLQLWFWCCASWTLHNQCIESVYKLFAFKNVWTLETIIMVLKTGTTHVCIWWWFNLQSKYMKFNIHYSNQTK